VFVAFVMQHAKRMRRIILSVATPALSTLSTLFHKRHNFPEKKYILWKNVFFFKFSLHFVPEKFLILRWMQQEIIIKIRRPSYKVPVTIFRFRRNLNFSTDVPKILKKKFMKICHWESSCSMRMDGQRERQTDRQTDMKKLTVAFHNFANASKSHRFIAVTPSHHWFLSCVR